MIGGGEVDIIFKDTGKFMSEGRGELWASVRDDGVMEFKALEYEVEKELSDSIGINRF